jgi:hypothetical protein
MSSPGEVVSRTAAVEDPVAGVAVPGKSMSPARAVNARAIVNRAAAHNSRRYLIVFSCKVALVIRVNKNVGIADPLKRAHLNTVR